MNFKKVPLVGSSHNDDARNNINLMAQIINNRGVEILSSAAFLDWLDENGIKHREEVQSFSDLPSGDSLNTVRGVADDNKIYIMKENGWVPFQSIDISKINEVDNKYEGNAINVQTLGVVGDGVTDDSDAIEYIFNNYTNFYFPLKNGYRVTRTLNITLDKDIHFFGEGSRIFLDSTEHLPEIFNVTCEKGLKINFEDLNFKGNKMCNKIFYIENNRISMDDENLSSIFAENVSIEGIKKLKKFSGDGSGLTARGAFSIIKMNGVKIYDCEMTKDEGISGVNGVTGISLIHFGVNSYVRKSEFINGEINKIYSSDVSYFDDQDGVKHLTPPGIESETFVENQRFIDCFTRSVKTQTGRTSIGKNTQVINKNDRSQGVVDAQYGNLEISSLIANQYGNVKRNTLVSSGSVDGLPSPPKMNADKVTVFMHDGGTMVYVFQTYPRGGIIGKVEINDVETRGDIDFLIDYRINGNVNATSISKIYTTKVNSHLVRLAASGVNSPYEADISASELYTETPGVNNILLDRIPNVSAIGRLTTNNNSGFSDNAGTMVVDRITDINKNAHFWGDSIVIEPGEIGTLKASRYDGAFIFLSENSALDGHLFMYAFRSGETILNQGNRIAYNKDEDPEDETRRINAWWNGNSELKVRNSHYNTQIVNVFVMTNRV